MKALNFMELNNDKSWTEGAPVERTFNYETHVFPASKSTEAFDLSRDNPNFLVYVKDEHRFWEIRDGRLTETVEAGFTYTMLQLHELLDDHDLN